MSRISDVEGGGDEGEGEEKGEGESIAAEEGCVYELTPALAP